MTQQCVKCTVSGRVQGVYFRASTQTQARRLNITGYAKNLPDGNVEILACGHADALHEIQQWLWQGPPLAKVANVQCEPVISELTNDFAIR